jgi:hypothetical protein
MRVMHRSSFAAASAFSRAKFTYMRKNTYCLYACIHCHLASREFRVSTKSRDSPRSSCGYGWKLKRNSNPVLFYSPSQHIQCLLPHSMWMLVAFIHRVFS